MEKNSNVINWFEIPVTDFSRAKKFYETITGIKMEEKEMGMHKMAFFPYEEGSGKISGAIVKAENYHPSLDGTVVYLNCNPDLSDTLTKVADAGGKVIIPKTEITPEYGYFAFIMDSEGNKVGLHSQK